MNFLIHLNSRIAQILIKFNNKIIVLLTTFLNMPRYFRQSFPAFSKADIAAQHDIWVKLHYADEVGPVAQWLEPAAHNRLVVGSSPTGPTTPTPLVRRSFSEGGLVEFLR
jgi:hypothetical protein